ncbi:poly polymerase catalytic domain-containing protein [Gaertneriomyces semiglobifer]|nr:poly polymerase catalytic domain-containing protein [Gaertneriomyces semiglobifer]
MWLNRILQVVDEYCPIAAKCHVYDGWDCMLNQTEISANNNKFYVIQLLKDDSADQFHVWTRWGRVGVKGQSKLEACTLDKGMKLFKSKFWDKTKNLWEDRENFEKIPGKYFLLEREFGDDDGDTAKGLDSAPPKSVKIPDSQLEEPVQELIKLIFNMKMMTQTMVEIGYNADKMPLGKLTKANIQKGYNVLAEIADVLNTPTATSQSLLSDLSSKFYTIIPHEFGMRRPQIINTPQLLKQKIEMVEALGDIQIATTLLSHTAANHDKNPIDLQYESLKADLHHVDPSSETFKLVNTYLKNTHAATHSNYALEIEDVFTVGRHGEDERFNQLPNRQLLWHGSRLTNFVGILSQGLRIAPPEAPVTGYMFGKGIYLANMVSKSSNYCFATRNSSTGILLLCEAALGDQLKLKQADYNADQSCRQANCHSTWGVGQTRPDPEGAISDPKDPNVKVPSGKPVKTNEQGCNLLYDEFIVYSVEQVKIRYLLKTKFHFKY